MTTGVPKKKKALVCGEAQLWRPVCEPQTQITPRWTLKHLSQIEQRSPDDQTKAKPLAGMGRRFPKSRMKAGLVPGIWILTQSSSQDMEPRAPRETGLFSEPALPV